VHAGPFHAEGQPQRETLRHYLSTSIDTFLEYSQSTGSSRVQGQNDITIRFATLEVLQIE